LVIPLDMRPTRNRPLIGTYGPETDAALQKAAMAMFGVGLPAGLTALGGPAGFEAGETLMGLLTGTVSAFTPPRRDNVLMGIMPTGPQGGARFDPEEGKALFNKTTIEQLAVVGRKGGKASGLARRLRALEAAEDEAFSNAMYRGPEVGPFESPAEASVAIDAQFPHLADAFKKSESSKARQEWSRIGGRMGGGSNRGASVRAASDMAAMRVRGSTKGSMLWAINPDTGGVRLAPYIPDDTKWSADLFATHADWFEQIKFPVAGPEFDRIPRGYARIDRGRLHITDNGI
jgi:hypothetical protein